jgi:hypothetical protein
MAAIKEIIAAKEEGLKVFLVTAGGQKMPIDVVLTSGKKVELVLRNGTVKSFREDASTTAIIKGKVQVVTASGKTISAKKKAEKSARDRELRIAMRGSSGGGKKR